MEEAAAKWRALQQLQGGAPLLVPAATVPIFESVATDARLGRLLVAPLRAVYSVYIECHVPSGAPATPFGDAAGAIADVRWSVDGLELSDLTVLEWRLHGGNDARCSGATRCAVLHLLESVLLTDADLRANAAAILDEAAIEESAPALRAVSASLRARDAGIVQRVQLVNRATLVWWVDAPPPLPYGAPVRVPSPDATAAEMAVRVAAELGRVVRHASSTA